MPQRLDCLSKYKRKREGEIGGGRNREGQREISIREICVIYSLNGDLGTRGIQKTLIINVSGTVINIILKAHRNICIRSLANEFSF